jgi:hypothetical protein
MQLYFNQTHQFHVKCQRALLCVETDEQMVSQTVVKGKSRACLGNKQCKKKFAIMIFIENTEKGFSNIKIL